MKKYNEENKERLKTRRQQWYLDNKERIAALQANYYKNNYERTLLSSIRQRARQKGIDFNLTIDDLKFPEVCPVLGIKLERSTVKVSHNSPSVDRIDPTKGYTKDNIQVISHKANAMKNNASQEELEMFARWVLKEKE